MPAPAVEVDLLLGDDPGDEGEAGEGAGGAAGGGEQLHVLPAPAAAGPPAGMVDIDELMPRAPAGGRPEPARMPTAAWADLAVAALGEALLGRTGQLRHVWGPLARRAGGLGALAAARDAAAADALARLQAFAGLMPPAEAARAADELRAAVDLLEECAGRWRAAFAAWATALGRVRSAAEAAERLAGAELAGLRRARDELLARPPARDPLWAGSYAEVVRDEFGRAAGAVRADADAACAASAAALAAGLAAWPAPATPPPPATAPPPVLGCWSTAADLLELRALVSLAQLADRALEGAAAPAATAA